MALPDFSMRQLLEAGAHFGHQAHRWNPKMSQYIFGTRNNIHIIDLAQTVPALYRALQAVSDTVAKGGRVLFVGTKRQAADAIADSARRSAQYYVNSRWLGGMLTNWKTISGSISRLRKLDETLTSGGTGLTKKELLMLAREKEKLEKALGGIKDMGGTPDLIFVIDTNVAEEQPENFEQLTAPRGAPDDLTKLTGVGPQLEKKLNDAGIYHYWQLAAVNPEDVTNVDADLKLHGRIDRDNWITQARTLIEAA